MRSYGWNVTPNYRTTSEIESHFGAQVKALRLDLDVDQATLAERAAVSLSAVKALEAGRGSSLRTVVRVVRALGRVDWLDTFFEPPSVSPIAIARAREGFRPPQRASSRRTRAQHES
jgi:transcriptional regulator with XRE-family HTH domain